MRYVLIFVGALVVAYLLTKGIRTFISDISERNAQKRQTDSAENTGD